MANARAKSKTEVPVGCARHAVECRSQARRKAQGIGVTEARGEKLLEQVLLAP